MNGQPVARKTRAMSVENHEVEQVRTYKLLGVTISDDLKWNAHVEYVIAKAGKRYIQWRIQWSPPPPYFG